MLKQMLKIVVGVALSSSLFAGTVGGGSDGRLMSTAFFDVHPRSQAPILDYITYSKRGSFDIKQFTDTVAKIKEKGTVIRIHGRAIVPEGIKTDKVYMNVGEKYNYTYNSAWQKKIYYNSSKIAQNADIFLVGTKTDSFENRYVDYKIVIKVDKAWDIMTEKNYHPNTFIFSMAPKVRGFKNKFEKADIYVLEE